MSYFNTTIDDKIETLKLLICYNDNNTKLYILEV